MSKGLEAEVLLEMARTDHALGRPVNFEELFDAVESVVEDATGWKDEFDLADDKQARAEHHADALSKVVSKLIDRLEHYEEMGWLPATQIDALHKLIKAAKAAQDDYENGD